MPHIPRISHYFCAIVFIGPIDGLLSKLFVRWNINALPPNVRSNSKRESLKIVKIGQSAAKQLRNKLKVQRLEKVTYVKYGEISKSA